MFMYRWEYLPYYKNRDSHPMRGVLILDIEPADLRATAWAMLKDDFGELTPGSLFVSKIDHVREGIFKI